MSDKKENPKKYPKPELSYKKILSILVILILVFYVTSLLFWIIFGGDLSWISSILLSLGTGVTASFIIYMLTNKRRHTEEKLEKQLEVFTGFLEAYIAVRNSLITENLKYLARENDPKSTYQINSDITSFPKTLEIFEIKCAFLIESEGKTIMNEKTIEAKIHEFYSKKHVLIEDYNAVNTSQDIENLLNRFEKEMRYLYEYIDSLKKETEVRRLQMKTSNF